MKHQQQKNVHEKFLSLLSLKINNCRRCEELLLKEIEQLSLKKEKFWIKTLTRSAQRLNKKPLLK